MRRVLRFATILLGLQLSLSQVVEAGAAGLGIIAFTLGGTVWFGRLGASEQTSCQPINTEKTNGESTPPAITSFSPARSGALSARKLSPMGSPLTIVPSLLERSRA